MTSGIASSYFGRAGHLFVMSEFLLRGWNVAIPEVDQGDDIFVVKHLDGTFRRVQVKSAHAGHETQGAKAQFSVTKSALFSTVGIIHFAFAIRQANMWSHLFIIDNEELQNFLSTGQSSAGPTVNLTIRISAGKITCRSQDFSPYLNDFKDFPVLI